MRPFASVCPRDTDPLRCGPPLPPRSCPRTRGGDSPGSCTCMMCKMVVVGGGGRGGGGRRAGCGRGGAAFDEAGVFRLRHGQRDLVTLLRIGAESLGVEVVIGVAASALPRH